MKTLLIALGIVSLAAIHQLWLGPALGEVAAASLDEEARLAIDLRCGEPASDAAVECRTELERLYASGALEPDRTLRAWCDEVKAAPWGRRHASPPAVCVERYGGW